MAAHIADLAAWVSRVEVSGETGRRSPPALFLASGHLTTGTDCYCAYDGRANWTNSSGFFAFASASS